MFHRILVPLDGSLLAESALPAARYLADTLGSAITLIHVIEKDAPSTVHGERHLRTPAEAEAYLTELRARVRPASSETAWHVHASASGNIVQSLVEHQDELSPDLIVMCTHGRGGLRRIFIGSIAQQVAASGTTPVLLIRPEGSGRTVPFALFRILAPLDGDRAHEQGLATALDLAKACGAGLHLLSVIPSMSTLYGRQATMGRLLPRATRRMLEMAETNMEAYLARQADRCRNAGVTATAETRMGEIAGTIIQVAETMDASLIVLGTHGKSGTKAFWTNSVAAGVQAQTRRPLMLLPLARHP